MSDPSDYSTCKVCKAFHICRITDDTGIESGLYECKKGHMFCKDCFPEFHEKAENNKFKHDDLYVPDATGGFFDEDIEEEDKEYYILMNKEICPVCKSKTFATNEEILKYLIEKSGKTKKQIIKEIKEIKEIQ